MTNKMKLLIGLLVLGSILVGGSIWFLLNPIQQDELLEITVTPAPGAFLTNSEEASSEVLLKDIQINKSVSDKPYALPWSSARAKAGELILIVSGSIQNMHNQNKEIGIYAEGYDTTGKQVAWALDTYSEGPLAFPPQIRLHLENGETGEFTLHLNFSEDIKSIRIYGSNYNVTPP
jgi:hypothetical protein